MSSMLMEAIIDNILLPIVVIIGSSLLLIVKSYAKKVTNSIISKNELMSLDNLTSIKNNLLSEIKTIVQAAVFTNMTLAENMKTGGKKLGDVEITMLQNSAKRLVYQSLPLSLTDENGPMLKIIGGQEKLDSIINGYLEQAVIDAKGKMSLIKK